MSKPTAYSHVVEVNEPHRTIYLAGQTGVDANGKVAEGFRAQATQVMENIKTALASVGGGFEHVVKLRSYTDLRNNITALGLSYVAGIQPQTSVWAPGTGPQPAKNWSGHGRPPKLLRRDGKQQQISVKKLAIGLPSHAWRKITWREATAKPLSSRFARVRVRAAHRDYWLAESRPEEWLLIEWPEGEEVPTKYWFATLPADIAFRQLVDTAKLRWRIERDYHELKQEVGLGHFEGRGWRGFHHHATLCIAAYGFLVSERRRFPPQEQVPPGRSKKLRFPKLIARGVPPLRPERHVANSIATVRRTLSAALVATLYSRHRKILTQ
jgi:enamine deaminase RidA (YjgF/YER057c/UK114 family)